MAGAWSEAVAPCEPQSPLRIAFTRRPATLRLAGVIDESTHCLLKDALSRAAQSPEHDLLIDLSEVEFCDLGGVRAIMSVATCPVAPRRVTLTGVPAETRTIIRHPRMASRSGRHDHLSAQSQAGEFLV